MFAPLPRHLVIGLDTLITAKCGLWSEVSRLLDECPLPFTWIKFLTDLRVFTARVSLVFAFWLIKRYQVRVIPRAVDRTLTDNIASAIGDGVFDVPRFPSSPFGVVLENLFRGLDLWLSNQLNGQIQPSGTHLRGGCPGPDLRRSWVDLWRHRVLNPPMTRSVLKT